MISQQHLRPTAFIACALMLAGGVTMGASIEGARLPPAAGRMMDFEKDILPIFATHCHACHGPEKQRGGLRLDVKSSAFKGGEQHAPDIVPGRSADSPLIRFVAGLDEKVVMPAKGKRLTPEQVGLLRAWIDQGAVWPEWAGGKVEDLRDWWSLRPIVRPDIPAVSNPRFAIHNPLDSFITAKLAEKGLSQSIEADRRTLIRRVYFDLIGLPPKPEDIRAFEKDRSPLAYENLVDRLLASPRYGERWARHWMDVVHFAETHGHDQDRIRTNAWPYRDYLIESFNADKPYARFIKEQLAADALYPREPRLTVAQGFIAAGPWDESSLRDILDSSIDRQIGYYLDRDDMVTTAMSTFTSTTVHCARCHDHKFDPITMRDYYALQAVFAGVGRADVVYDEDVVVHEHRWQLRRQQAELGKAGWAAIEKMLSPKLEEELARWEEILRTLERQAQDKPPQWTVLSTARLKSDGDAKFIRKEDGSILVSGPLPETDTYTVTAYTDLKGITGVRLEVLPDPSLPMQGPGRKTNGNLHLTELRLKVSPRPLRPESDVEEEKPPAEGRATEEKWFLLQNATADFSQKGFEASRAADADTDTAWGIYPEVGKAHAVWFELKEPVTGFTNGTKLKFYVQQFEPGFHLIGRFRLSITTNALPVRMNYGPMELTKLLAIPPAQRTREQQLELASHYLKGKIATALAALPAPQKVFAAAGDFVADGRHKPVTKPRPVNILRRGDIKKPAEAVPPGSLECISALPASFKLRDVDDEAARRAALAEWIASPQNPLTWRSIVNRVWHYHFGRGLVDTPNDFGRMGSRPTHPELLDWLAAEFRDGGGSFKELHRLIVTSATYRQTSTNAYFKLPVADSGQPNRQLEIPSPQSLDADNRLLWRMNRARLDAECGHVAALQVSGRLDLKMGGPSVQQFVLGKPIHVTPTVDYTKYDWDSPGSGRRSVYRFIFRTLPDPFMDALDCADASQLTAARNVSVTALQALAMLNNQFMLKQSEHFAQRLRASSHRLGSQIKTGFQLALSREPSKLEQVEFQSYAERHGLENFCRLLLNSNEFIFVN